MEREKNDFLFVLTFFSREEQTKAGSGGDRSRNASNKPESKIS